MRVLARRSAAAIFVALALALSGAFAAIAASGPPQPPEQVADYFENGLIPRLIDLYGAGDGVTKGIDFDATTKVGSISRVEEWTPDFLAGKGVADPTRVTNNWVAAVSVRGKVLGLATVWINPATDLPELASFDSANLARLLAKAPPKSSLVHDVPRQAWFALEDQTLTPLVVGTSGVTGVTTPGAYQRSLAPQEPVSKSGFPGVAVSALVLGVVILGLAIFVLLPVGRRASPDAVDEVEDADS